MAGEEPLSHLRAEEDSFLFRKKGGTANNFLRPFEMRKFFYGKKATIGGIIMEQKKLYRSRNNRMICGVCGGVAEYFNIDATLIRLLLVLLGCTGSGIVAYFIAAIIIPDEK